MTIAAIGGILLGMKSLLDMPEGYYDAQTHRCIAVVDSAGVRPCQQNDRHEAVIVKSGTTYSQIKERFYRH